MNTLIEQASTLITPKL